MEIKRNGVKLFFQLAGQGNSAFVFIHGTGGDHTHFLPQFAHFSRTRKVLNMDLRGHGKSDKPEQSYTVEGFADDVAWLCKTQGIEKPVVIGLSMGGNIAIELAAQFPELPSAIILLDSSILYPTSVKGIFDQYLEGLKSDHYQDHIHQIIKNSCLPTDQGIELIEKSLLNTPQYVWRSAFENLLKWNDRRSIDRIKQCKIPVLYIQAATSSLTNLVYFAELCPQLVTAKTVGSGHILTLGAPEQINPMIERFIKILFWV